jgi:chromosome segregation ATPase
MAKRSTIGENPLDTVRSESPLDAVVPDLSAPRPGRAQALAPEIKERLEKLEAGFKGAAAEAAQLRGWIAPLKDEAARATAEAAQLKSELARITGELSRLKAELEALKTEQAQLKGASRAPSDMPWWLGGRKKA